MFICRGPLVRQVGQTLWCHTLRRKAITTTATAANKPFHFQDILEPQTKHDTPWKKLTGDFVSTSEVLGEKVLRVKPEALTMLSEQAYIDVAHLLRPAHLQQLSNILKDPEASSNDHFVALELLKNANIAAGMVLPGCQDTGTAICMGKKGQYVWTEGRDEESISQGIYNTYTSKNLRYSQGKVEILQGQTCFVNFVLRSAHHSLPCWMEEFIVFHPPLQQQTSGKSDGVAEMLHHAHKTKHGNCVVAPLDMFKEANTGTNLPGQIEIYATLGNEYHFMFIAKGGGSANKTFLYQQTKALLNPEKLMKFVNEKVQTLGTAACPPYHLAFVVGGTSAEYNLKTVKLASTKYLDNLHTSGNEHGRAFRDLELESEIHKLTQKMGIGAQFGGKYFCHDVRVIRLPRHGASCPVGIGVSCSADRQVLGKITSEGVFIEELDTDPSKYLPDVTDDQLGADVVKINMNKPMSEQLGILTQYPIRTQLSLTGTLVVARDIAHAKLQERINAGEGLPQYMKDHPVYYAGPAKTPEGYASGSFGPTTAGRMDSYVADFQAAGGSMVMLAKGNRSKQVTAACKKHGGFYLGSIGGPAAILAQNCIKKVEVLEYEELGMEAIWRVEVEDFPAFIVVDDKGNDFFKEWQTE